jgi:hypothetical protein
LDKNPNSAPPLRQHKRQDMSRREFTFSAALAAAGLTLPAGLAAQQEKPPATTPAPVKPPEEGPKLSEAAKREVELKVQWVMDRYGARLSESQKADVRKALSSTQEGLEALRAFAIENWDEPASVLHFDESVSPAKQSGVRR